MYSTIRIHEFLIIQPGNELFNSIIVLENMELLQSTLPVFMELSKVILLLLNQVSMELNICLILILIFLILSINPLLNQLYDSWFKNESNISQLVLELVPVLSTTFLLE